MYSACLVLQNQKKCTMKFLQNKKRGMSNVRMRHVNHVHTAVVCRDGWRGHVTRHVTRMNTPCQSCACVMSHGEGTRGMGSCSGVCMAPYNNTT